MTLDHARYLLFVFIVIHIVPRQVSGQQTKKVTTDGVYYWEHLPPGYADPGNNSKYPLLIFLHGCGEMAFRNGFGCPPPLDLTPGLTPWSELDKVLRAGPPKEINEGSTMCFTVNGQQECFVVLSPQINGLLATTWTQPYVEGVIRYALDHYRVDRSRVYLTGLSLGGTGTYSYAMSNRYFADSLAAIAPVAGVGSTERVCVMSDRHMGLWAFHGSLDSSFPTDLTIITNMLACVPPPDPPPLFTIFPGIGHAPTVWNTAYDPGRRFPESGNLSLYEWLLQNGGAASGEPPAGGSWLELNYLGVPGRSVGLYYTTNKSNASQWDVRYGGGGGGGGNDHLEFYVRALTVSPDWRKLKVELTVSYQTRYVYAGDYMTGSGTGWLRVSIPLTAFGHDPDKWQQGGVSLVNFKAIYGFAAGHYGLDEIRFCGGTSPFLWYGDDYTLSGSPGAVSDDPEAFFIIDRPEEGGVDLSSTLDSEASSRTATAVVPAGPQPMPVAAVAQVFDLTGRMLGEVPVGDDNKMDLRRFAGHGRLLLIKKVTPSGAVEVQKVLLH